MVDAHRVAASVRGTGAHRAARRGAVEEYLAGHFVLAEKAFSFSSRAQRPPSRAIGGVVAVGGVDVPRRNGPAMPPRAQDVAVARVVHGTLQHLAYASAGEQLVVFNESQHQLGCQLIYAKCRLLWDDRQRIHISRSCGTRFHEFQTVTLMRQLTNSKQQTSPQGRESQQNRASDL